MSESSVNQQAGFIDVVKQRGLYMGLSLLFLIPGIIFIFLSVTQYDTHSPIRLGIDFTGGTMLELGMERRVAQDDIPKVRAILEERGYPGAVVQIQEPTESVKASSEQAEAEASPVAVDKPHVDEAKAVVEGKKAVDTKAPVASKPHGKVKAHEPKAEAPKAAVAAEPVVAETPAHASEAMANIVSIRSKQIAEADYPSIKADLEKAFGHFQVLQRNSVGPTLASELLANGLMALVLAYVLIVGYFTYRFQFDFAMCAIVALIHDTLTVFGFFAMMGYLFHTEVDSMFITGILTVVGFSVHDTIVVFDRLRENMKRYYSQRLPFSTIANISVNQTLARSINTSLTALLTLLALYFFGGETTKDFVLCMILGIAIGTYSSIFVASTMLVWWRERNLTQSSQNASPATV